MLQSLLGHIGKTPLVRLQRLAEGVPATVWVKVESLNPGGSVKDRVGLAMVEEAERRGWLARRHDHRGDRRQHRRRPGHGRRRQGLSLHLRPARQDERREDPPAQGLRRRDRHHADGRRPRFARQLQRRRRPPDPRDPRRLAAQPVRQPRQSRGPLPHHRPGDLGADRGPDHRLRRRASAPAARSPAWAATSRSGTPTIRIIGGRPRGLGPVGRLAAALESRGDRRGFRAQDAQRPDRRRMDPRRRRRVVPHGAGRWRAARASWWGARAARRSPPRCGTPAGSGPTTWSSPSAPTPGGTT